MQLSPSAGRIVKHVGDMLFGETGRFRVSEFTSRHDVSYGGFLGHRGTPFHHPDFTGIFPELNHPAIKGYPHDYGTPHMFVATGSLQATDGIPMRSSRNCYRPRQRSSFWEAMSLDVGYAPRSAGKDLSEASFVRGASPKTDKHGVHCTIW